MPSGESAFSYAMSVYVGKGNDDIFSLLSLLVSGSRLSVVCTVMIGTSTSALKYSVAVSTNQLHLLQAAGWQWFDCAGQGLDGIGVFIVASGIVP